MSSEKMPLNRRQFLRFAGLASGVLASGSLLAACQQATPAAPTAAPAKPAESKPASAPAAKPTAAAAAAAKPAEAAKPAQQTAPAAKGSMPTVKIQGLATGMTAVTVKAMETSGIAEKNGFKIEPMFLAANVAGQQFLQGASNVSSDADTLDVAEWRNQGRKIVVFGPTINNNIVAVVKKDAPYTTITDLKGKRVGQIGLDSGTTTTFAVLMKKLFNLDYQKDFTLVDGSPPALLPLLDKGEVDAILHFDPYVSRALVELPTKIIWGPFSKEWQQATGSPMTLAVFAAHEDWIKQNKDVALSVAKANREVLQWLPKNLSIFDSPEYHKLLGIEDPKVIDMVKKRVVDVGMWDISWDAAARKAHQELINVAAANNVIINKDPGGVIIEMEEYVKNA